jgi:putative restriction endonuclease
MAEALDEETIRGAALDWLRAKTFDGTVSITRDELASDFLIAGQRFPLIDRARGIRRPRGWRAALSISTPTPKPGRPRRYDDDAGPDGLQRYRLRRDHGGSAENESLRAALREQAPLIWFVGVAPSVFNALFPVWITAEEPEHDRFVVALSESQREVAPLSVVEEWLRRYIAAETKRRLHQPLFASQVMVAYENHCAVCNLHHRELLDAAHIIPDSDPRGLLVVANGLALCKIHHAAYDRNILGVRPDYVVQIHHRLFDEIDGPMLRHGLQEHHNRPLMQVPRRRFERPDPDRLMERYAQFQAA